MIYSVTINGQTYDIKARDAASAAARGAGKAFGSVMPRGDTNVFVCEKGSELAEAGMRMYKVSAP